MLFCLFLVFLLCSVSGLWTEFVVNLWSLIDKVGFRLEKGKKQAFCLRRKKNVVHSHTPLLPVCRMPVPTWCASYRKEDEHLSSSFL